MLSNNHPYQERFHALLDEIRDEIGGLHEEISELKKENNRLRDKLEEIQDGQTDIFAAITETERIALRHQVIGLISKIDDHLGEQA